MEPPGSRSTSLPGSGDGAPAPIPAAAPGSPPAAHFRRGCASPRPAGPPPEPGGRRGPRGAGWPPAVGRATVGPARERRSGDWRAGAVGARGAAGRAAELRGKRTERGGGRHAQREARPRQPRARRPPRASGRAAPRGVAFPDGGNARKAAVVSRGAGGGRPGPTRAAPRGQGVPGRELRSKPS